MINLFKQPTNKVTVLSLLSALIIGSTVFLGTSYAQQTNNYNNSTSDSSLTTSEEQEMTSEGGTSGNATSSASSGHGADNNGNTQGNDTAAASTEESDGTAVAAINELTKNLVVCDLGTIDVRAPENRTTIAADAPTPVISMSVVPESELGTTATSAMNGNGNTTTSSDNETSASGTNTAAAEQVQCLSNNQSGGEESNETSSSAASSANGMMAGGSNTTSSDNETATNGNATTSASSSSAKSSVAPEKGTVVEIKGSDFMPGQVVLMFVDNGLRAIDDVDDNGNIEAKVRIGEQQTQTAGADNQTQADVRIIESGTMRSADFEFDGKTLTAADNSGEIMAEGNGPASGNNSTDTSPSMTPQSAGSEAGMTQQTPSSDGENMSNETATSGNDTSSTTAPSSNNNTESGTERQ